MKKQPVRPPQWIDRFLQRRLNKEACEEVTGDLHELFGQWVAAKGPARARLRYIVHGLGYLRPLPRWLRKKKPGDPHSPFIPTFMLSNYFKVAWRNLLKTKMYSLLNIGGLAAGMTVVLLIGLWVWDEISFDKYHRNYRQLAQVWQFVSFDANKSSYNSVPVPLGEELRSQYPEIVKASVTTYKRNIILSAGNDKFSSTGMFSEKDFPEMITLRMIAGKSTALAEPQAMLLSASMAKTLFGTEDPMGKVVRLNNKANATVKGVYEDLPDNSSFHDVYFIAPWALLTTMDNYAKNASTEWDENSFQVFVQLREGADLAAVSAKIKDIRMKREDPPAYKPEFFLHPMSRWHLHSEFNNGVNEGGLIRQVRLFGMAGIFVLLLACINFMNLSTARSERRAREVGIRKTMGSYRSQLLYQFFSESVLYAFLSLLLALLLAQLCLPFFNAVAGKDIGLPWGQPVFWVVAVGFCLLTGILSGSYPALYLSSFRATEVLKGSFRAGRLASLPRKALVVFQFMVSLALIIGTIVVSRQIAHAKDRPVGYERNGLIEINVNTPDLRGRYDVLRAELLRTGAVQNMSQSESSVTDDYGGTTAVNWKGKRPDERPLIMANRVSHDFGSTIGWRLVAGRDFSRQFVTDSSAMVINETAAKLMGLKAVGETVQYAGRDYTVIGVIGDVIKDDPFKPVKPSFFVLSYGSVFTVNIRLLPQVGTATALKKIEEVFQKFNPAAPFEYKFVDEKFAGKFEKEVRIGKLAQSFAILAIFISLLGTFGLASFMAEQRTREIGIRKVLGATVADVWQLLSREFVLLVLLATCIASPLAYYIMNRWLEDYTYRTGLSWWIFAAAGTGALLITLLTVSFQAIRAGFSNPVKTLRS